jgi:hypothetical protein
VISVPTTGTSCTHRPPVRRTAYGYQVSHLRLDDHAGRHWAWWLAMVGCVDHLAEVQDRPAPNHTSNGVILSPAPSCALAFIDVAPGQPYPDLFDWRYGCAAPKPSKRASAHPPDYVAALRKAHGVDRTFLVKVAMPMAMDIRHRLLMKGSPAPTRTGWAVINPDAPPTPLR